MPIEQVIEKYRSSIEEKREKRESTASDCSTASSSSGYASVSDSGNHSAGSSSKIEEEPQNGVTKEDKGTSYTVINSFLLKFNTLLPKLQSK